MQCEADRIQAANAAAQSDDDICGDPPASRPAERSPPDGDVGIRALCDEKLPLVGHDVFGTNSTRASELSPLMPLLASRASRLDWPARRLLALGGLLCILWLVLQFRLHTFLKRQFGI